MADTLDAKHSPVRTWGKMGRVLNFVSARDEFLVTVERPIPELVANLRASLVPSRQHVQSGAGAKYTGEVSESGFVIRRIAVHPKDTKAAVVVRGWFQYEDDRTVVRIVVRHGWHMIAFSWLLFFMAVFGFFAVTSQTAGTQDGTDTKHSLGGIAIMAGIAALCHWKLYLDVRRVKDEVRSLLQT
jgi:hypothetical protein